MSTSGTTPGAVGRAVGQVTASVAGWAGAVGGNIAAIAGTARSAAAYGFRAGLRRAGFWGGGSGGGRPAPMAYDAGRLSRHDADFFPASIGPNAANGQYLDLAVRRIRSLMEDNPIIAGARDLFIRNVVGRGIFPEPDTGLESLDDKIEELFWAEAEAVDVGRETALTTSQEMHTSEVFSAGEVLVHLPVADSFRGFARGAVIELVDRDRMPLDGPWTMRLGRGGDGLAGITHSVELDAAGRRVAYHVLPASPFDLGAVVDLTPRRVSAMDATLSFFSRRLGQLRGMPWAVPVLTTTRLEDSFTEAALLLEKARACLGLIFEGSAPILKPGDPNPFRDLNGNPMNEMRPGMVGQTPPGFKVHSIANAASGPGIAVIEELLLRRMAAGLGVGYSALTRDRSKSTFSSDRSDALEDRKQWRRWQIQQIWHQHTRPWYRRMLDVALLTGRLKLTGEERAWLRERPQALYECTVITPGWEWVNPLQEAQADEVAMRSGTKSLADVAGAMGKHWQDVVDQRLQEEAYEAAERERLGLPPKTPPNGMVNQPGTPGLGTEQGDAPDGEPPNPEDNSTEAAAIDPTGEAEQIRAAASTTLVRNEFDRTREWRSARRRHLRNGGVA